MAFDWIRPRSMPDTEPSEDQIWRVIDRFDPSRSASIRDRLSWYHEMLMERDIYDGLFTRSPRLPVYDSDLPSGHDPTDWVISLRLRHSNGHSLDHIVEGLSYGVQDVLQPVADLAEHTGTVRLLSYSLSRYEVDEQRYDSVFGSPLQMLRGYVCWARHILRLHQRVLRQAGVYRAIYVSLFDYSRLSYSWLQGLAEHWDSVTNTWWIGPNEMTITLWDLQMVSGLPILGIPYEECIPQDCELFRRQLGGQSRRGQFVYSDGLHQCLSHYYHLHRHRSQHRHVTVTLEDWIVSLLSRDAYTVQSAHPQDPFEIGFHSVGLSLVGIFEPESAEGTQYIYARGVSEEMSLVAFIATWLCSFVFPSQDRSLRPSTLLMASLIASGRQVSLAPAGLAQIYYGFGQISASYGRRQRAVEVPWHYVHGWVHIHVEGAFSCAELPGYYSDHYFPLLIQLARATSATDRAQIRLFLFAPLHMGGRFRLVYRSPVGDLPSQSFGVSLLDSLTERGRPTLLSRSGFAPIASYFVSMRPGWICYRRDHFIVLEGYNPNRAARQFGFVQATPLDGLPALPGVTDHRRLRSLSLSASLEVAAQTWAFLFRFGTGSCFCIAPLDASTGISHLRLSWIRHTFSSFFELGIQRYSRRIRGTCRQRHSSGLRDYAPTHTDSFKVPDRRRKRSPEPSVRRRDTAPTRRHVSPPFVRGQPRRRTSYEQTASQFTPADLPGSPMLDPVCVDTVPTCLDIGDRRASYVDHIVSDIGGLVPELVTSSSTLSDSTWVIVGESPGGFSPGSQNTHSGSTHLLLESDHDATTTELVTHPSSTQVVLNYSSRESSPGVTSHPGDHLPTAFTEDFQILGLELSYSVSRSVFRSRRSSTWRWLRGVQYAVAALRALLLRVNLDTPPDLFSFHTEVCLLLDFATSCGLRDSLLQMWEHSCCTVEFGLFQLHYTHWRLSCMALDDLETEARAAWDRMRRGRLDLDIGLQTWRRCQRDISEEQVVLLSIEAELRALRQRERALLARRQEVRAVATRTEEDFSSIAVEVEHLEHRLSFFTEEFDSTYRQLEFVEEQRVTLQERSFRVREQISSIQFRL